ncbi:MAG: response regulator [Nitratireductor sp.]|nr:response regulator [Nitratireductor sp.]
MTSARETGRFITRHSELFSLALAVLAAVLLGVTAFLYHDLSKRMVSLNSGFKEDTLWAVYQVDRELRRFAHSVDTAAAKPDDTEAFKSLLLRYDIVWSRIDLLTRSGYQRQFESNPDFLDSVTRLSNGIKGSAPLIDAIAARGSPDRRELGLLKQRFAELTASAERLLQTSNNSISTERAERREEVVRQSNLTERVVIALVVSVFALLLLLRRQIANTRKVSEETTRIASQLEDALRGAEAGNRAKSSFLATISHEIRTPLNAIIGLSEILLESPKLESEARGDVQSIRRSGEILLDILNEVLDYTSIENNALKIEEREIHLADLLDSCVDLFKANAAKKGISLELVAETGSLNRWILSDPTRLRQILLNLVGNAVKFTEKGTVSVNVRFEDNGDDLATLSIDVCDTGTGITAEGLGKLFKPFAQVDSSITRKYGGTGLGLAIAKGIIEKLDGRIGAESTPGKGSTFWIRVPVRTGQAPGTMIEDAGKAPPLQCLNVLVVEDNATNRKVAAALLQRLGQNVHCASDGEEAVRIAEHEPFDLILMDMQMPVMSGIEATIAIRASNGPNRQTCILAMTANASPDDRCACLEAGMDGFESKPVRKQRLRQILEMLGDKAGTDEAGSQHEVSSNVPAEVGDNLAFVNPARKAELIGDLGEDQYWELWESHSLETQSLISDILDDLENGRDEQMRAKLHTLKGSAENMGLDALSALAAQLRKLEEPAEAVLRLRELSPSFRDHERNQAA